MPQQTNLNVSPYFDDFDPADDFHKVLFKPGYPVQARELTNLQSILLNQVEKFGQHFFKEGARVIPGNTGYTQLYNCIQLNNNYQGVPVAAYVDQLVDQHKQLQEFLENYSVIEHNNIIGYIQYFLVLLLHPL